IIRPDQKQQSPSREIRVKLDREPNEEGTHLWLNDKLEVVVFRINGELKILNSICPHMGAQMVCRNRGSELFCPWHGLVYSTKSLNSTHFRYRKAREFRGEISNGYLTVFI